ncbi:54S ribosomal protein L2 mitochondrial [Mucor circinelloides]
MAKRETCLWIFPVRWAVFIISFIIAGVSGAFIAITFLHRNPMMIHLAVIHAALPWVYIIILAVTGVIGIFGLLASLAGSHGFMVMYKIMFWLMTFLIVYIWQIIIFILALVNRTKTTEACNKANPNQDYSHTENANATIEGYTTTLLGLNYGETYGLANCDQAVEAGVIGIAICLFVGGLFITWFAFTVNKCARSLDTNSMGSRARNARWDVNLDELQSAYAKDRKNAPKYPLKDMNGPSKFSRGLMKMKLKKSHN